MLIADIKIVPHGDWDNVREIRRLNIANLGLAEGGTDICNYACWFSETEDEYIRVPDHLRGSEIRVEEFRHSRSDGAEECVRRALDALAS